MTRSLVLALAVFAGASAPAAAQQPITPLGSMLRLTTTGTDGDANFDADRPAAALDSKRNRMFMVYDAVDPSAPTSRDVWGVLLNADGSTAGTPAKLATGEVVGVADDLKRPAPAIAYSALSDGFLVAFSGGTDATAGGHHEIKVLRLNPDGVVISGPTTISTTAGGVDVAREAVRPAVTADTEGPGFLVAWEADEEGDNNREIWSRRVDGGGAPMGALSVKVSTTTFGAYSAHAVYVPTIDQYVVAWSGDGGAIGGDDRVFVSALDKTSGAVGAQVDISDGSTVATQDALGSDVTYNPAADELLVAFLYEANSAAGGVFDSEVFVQRVGSDLTEHGEESRVSTVDDSNFGLNAELPRVAYNAGLDRYVVTWRADGAVAGQAAGEFELFMQVLNGADVAEIGGDVRLTRIGADADAQADVASTPLGNYFANGTQIVANPTTKEWVSLFAADKAEGAMANDEYEVFGRRIGINNDVDGDGAPVGADCNDNDANVKPGATEVLDNAVDEDCSGVANEDPDRDRDGSPRPADCADNNAGIRPGLADVPANGIDEDCSGADAAKPPPLPPVTVSRVESTVAFQFALSRGRTTVRVLTVNKLLKGDTVEVRCSGKGCKTKRTVFKITKSGSKPLTSVFRRVSLRNGARIEIRITRPGAIGKVVRFPIKRASLPKSQVLCLPVGSTKPVKTC